MYQTNNDLIKSTQHRPIYHTWILREGSEMILDHNCTAMRRVGCDFHHHWQLKTLSLKKHTVTVGVGWHKHTQSLGFQHDFDMIWPFSLLGWESKGLQLTTTFRTSRGSNIASSWPIVGAFVYWIMCSPTDNHLRTRWAPTIVTNGVIGPYKWPKIIEVTFFFTLPTHRRKKTL